MFYKGSSVINLIYSGQKLFSYITILLVLLRGFIRARLSNLFKIVSSAVKVPQHSLTLSSFPLSITTVNIMTLIIMRHNIKNSL
jgi:hypothetical protein